MDPNRPAYKIDASRPGSDVAMEMAAAMACGSIAFKNKGECKFECNLCEIKVLADWPNSLTHLVEHMNRKIDDPKNVFAAIIFPCLPAVDLPLFSFHI